MKHDNQEMPEDAVVVADLTDNDPFPYKLTDVASMLNRHRVTLLRMFQAGRLIDVDTGEPIVPKWRKLPVPHRVFSHEDFERIKKAIDKMTPDREYVEEIHEVTLAK